jgi:hypothetical protein
MSLGGGGIVLNPSETCASTQEAVRKAICAATTAGITVVAAAGNSVTSFSSTWPAMYPEVLTVTAMGDSDGKPGGWHWCRCMGSMRWQVPCYRSSSVGFDV